MRIRWLTREYERTCDDCGHTWHVPKWAAHSRMQGLPVSRGGQGGVPPPVGVAVADAVVETIDKLAERRAAGFRHCPKCGSENYKQRPARS